MQRFIFSDKKDADKYKNKCHNGDRQTMVVTRVF